MRRVICEITEKEEIEAILLRCRVGRFATIGSDGYPYVVPVNYVYWQGSIYFHCSRQGMKTDNLVNDNRVCFEVDIPLAYLASDFYSDGKPPCMVHQFYHSVIIKGRAELIEEADEKVGALNALVASHEPGVDLAPITPDTPAVDICAVVAVRVEEMSGKRDLAQKRNNEDKVRLAQYLTKRGLEGDLEAAELIGKSVVNDG